MKIARHMRATQIAGGALDVDFVPGEDEWVLAARMISVVPGATKIIKIVTFLPGLDAVATLAAAAVARPCHAVRVSEGVRQARRPALLHAKNVHSRPRAALRHPWDC